jgi:hypothetical protein
MRLESTHDGRFALRRGRLELLLEGHNG